MEKAKPTIGVFALCSMYIAYCCSCTSIPNGAMIGQGASFSTGFAGIMLGWLIGAIVVSGTTYITYTTGTFKDVIWREMFGRHGSRICSFMMAFCMGFWATFDFFNGGQSLYNLMPEGSFAKNMGFCICVFGLVVITIIGGVVGTTGVKWISSLTAPVAVILLVVVYVATVKEAGGMAAVTTYQPPEATISVINAAQIMVGMWMGGFCGIMDLAPGAKSGKSVILASIAGVGFIMLCFLVGQMGFIGTGLATLGDICMSLGGAIFMLGNIFVIFAQGNTTPACNLMYSNSFAHAFSLTRKPFAIIVPIIAAGMAFVIMYGPGVDFINTITDVVSTVMAPLVGVTLADFWIVRKRTFEFSDVEALPAFRLCATLCLAIGVVVSFLFKLTPNVPGTAFLTVIITGLLYAALRLGAKMK